MRVEHTTKITCRCPVDTTIMDIYDLSVVVTDRTLTVEEILSAIRRHTQNPAFQESLTQALASELKAQVTTVGYHSGVKTTCSC